MIRIEAQETRGKPIIKFESQFAYRKTKLGRSLLAMIDFIQKNYSELDGDITITVNKKVEEVVVPQAAPEPIKEVKPVVVAPAPKVEEVIAPKVEEAPVEEVPTKEATIKKVKGPKSVSKLTSI